MHAETFAASQLDLFSVGLTSKSIQQQRNDFAWSPTVREELMQLFQSRAGEWLEPFDFMPLATKYGIGHLIGHVVSQMSREGLVKKEDRYFGSKFPWEGNYRGFKSVYMLEVAQCQTA
jgi:hypothetical protein